LFPDASRWQQRPADTIRGTLQLKENYALMIAREWKCRVPDVHSEGFTAYLYETGIKDSSATPGFLGAQIFRRALDGRIELTLITYWDKLESITAFAGSDISQARLYPEDEVYELEPDHLVQHYEVIEHQISPQLETGTSDR
jgi:heme-degrading monooxygenase HmoA